MCGLCSRLRRGRAVTGASELGATKVALGTTATDIVETLFLNMFYAADEGHAAEAPLHDGKHVVIRPLAYCAEHDIARYARARLPDHFRASFAARRTT